MPTLLDIIVEYAKSDERAKTNYFLARKGEELLADKELVQKGMSRYGVGEGLVPIDTNSYGHIILLTIESKDKDGKVERIPIPSKKMAYNGMWHHNLFTNTFAIDVARELSQYHLEVIKALGGFDGTLPEELVKEIKYDWLGVCNTNPSYRRDRYNLILSLKEYEKFPEELDVDSIAGMNLSVVVESLLRFAVMKEDVTGRKVVIKKSEIDGNPLIREGVKVMVYDLAKKEIEASRKAQKKNN